MYCVNCRSELNKNTDISNHVNSLHVTQTLLGLQRVFKLHMGFEIAEVLDLEVIQQLLQRQVLRKFFYNLRLYLFD